MTSVASDSSAPRVAESSKARAPAELRAAVTDALRAEAVAKDTKERDRAGRQLISIFADLEQDQKLPREERVQLHGQVRFRLLALEKMLRAEKAKEPRHSSLAADSAKSAKDTLAGREPETILAQFAAPAARQRGRVVPGPGAVGGAGAAGPAVVGQSQSPDYGLDLVDLIHAVVQPSTWDVNGGPGSVVYYRNFRVLVVTAPSEVHSDIGDRLGQLRK
jgi:hypothetical protein